MKAYIISPEARADIQEIRIYLRHEGGNDVQKIVIGRFKDAFEKLSDSPSIGHIREDLIDEPLKFWHVYSYLIVYNPFSKPLEIVRVLHGHREVDRILADEG